MADNYIQRNGTLKNLIGIDSPDDLATAEGDYVPARREEWDAGQVSKPPAFDEAYLRALHKHLFQDIFEWAGRTRDEPVRLSDGTTAQMPVMYKPGSKPFLMGPFIKPELTALFTGLKAGKYLKGLDRDAFANKAADVFTRLNTIHPFREGNGRTQRTLICDIAIAAGHKLDFSVVSSERNIDVSIRSGDGDLEAMRRLFREIATPERVEALRFAQQSLARNNFPWRDRYIATTEPGHRYEQVTLVGVAGNQFMARTDKQILVGWKADLPPTLPEKGETFSFTATAPSSDIDY